MRRALEEGLAGDLQSFFAAAAAERKLLTDRQRQPQTERSKLLKAHLADAVPLDLLKTEQKRISDQLRHIEQRLADTDHHHASILANLRRSLDLAADLHTTYASAPQALRRLVNQAIFRRLYIEEDGDITADLAEPFETILDTQLHQRVLALADEPADQAVDVPKPDWQLWEASLEAMGDEETDRRPFGRLG